MAQEKQSLTQAHVEVLLRLLAHIRDHPSLKLTAPDSAKYDPTRQKKGLQSNDFSNVGFLAMDPEN